MLFHPALVHFPIAFYVLEFILLIFYAVKKDAQYRHFALFVFKAGFVLMIAAAVAGYIDAGGISQIQMKKLDHFRAAMLLATASVLRAFYWRFGRADRKYDSVILTASSLLVNLLVLLTAYLGGELVYG